jgi:hypothetical protein
MRDRVSEGLKRRNSAESALTWIDPTGSGGSASRFAGHIDAVDENRRRPEAEKWRGRARRGAVVLYPFRFESFAFERLAQSDARGWEVRAICIIDQRDLGLHGWRIPPASRL